MAQNWIFLFAKGTILLYGSVKPFKFTNFRDYNGKIYKFWRIKVVKHILGLQKEWLHPVLPTG
jgi:hypothetical protein